MCVCVCVCVAVLAGGFALTSRVEAAPPWTDPVFPDVPVVPVLAGSDAASAPRMWCTSSQTATFEHAGNDTYQFVRVWVPGGGTWLKAEESGRANLGTFHWFHRADYALHYQPGSTDSGAGCR